HARRQPAAWRIAGRTWLLGGGGRVDHAWRRCRAHGGGTAQRRVACRRCARARLAPLSSVRLQPGLCPRAGSAAVPRSLRHHPPLAADREPAWSAPEPIPPPPARAKRCFLRERWLGAAALVRGQCQFAGRANLARTFRLGGVWLVANNRRRTLGHPRA